MDLQNLRTKISSLDSQIVNLLNERATLSQDIGAVKQKLNSEDTNPEIYAPGQEKAVFERVNKLNNGPLPSDALTAIYREIMSASISLQKDVKIGYLGPRGSFTHQAALNRFGDSVIYIPIKSIPEIMTQIEDGTLTYGVVPFENSSTGVVFETLDGFFDHDKIKIRAESYQEINQSLISHFPAASIRRIYSHRVAFGQCQQWIEQNLSHVERVTVASTSAAAELASSEMYSAAICSSLCSKLYDVPIINEGINDHKYNYTRFLILGHNSEKPSGNDRTLAIFTVDHRKPGALCDTLKAFKDNDINLTKIDTRPYPKELKPWHYKFVVEFEGHLEDENVSTVINEVQKFCLDIKVLGSYLDQKPE